MKKAIKILGLVLGPLSIVVGIVCLVVGILLLTNAERFRAEPTILSRLTDQQYLLFCCFYIYSAIQRFCGSVFYFIHSANAYNEKLGKGKGIALGIVGGAFGALVTGVLMVVDSAIHRH